MCDIALDTGEWDWEFVVNDSESKNGSNYVSFDLYKHTNTYRLSPDVSAVVKIPVSGSSDVSFICDQVPAKSKVAISNQANVYLIADFNEERTTTSGILANHKGLKIIGYDSNYKIDSETSWSWEYEASVGSPGFVHSMASDFTLDNSIKVAATVYYQPLYLQPLSFSYDPANNKGVLSNYEITVENKDLTFARGIAISDFTGDVFYNLSTESIINGEEVTHSYIRKVIANSEVDPNFGHLGNLNVTPENHSFRLESITMVDDENIIASGYSTEIDNKEQYNTVITKVSQSGVIDTSFGENGYLVMPIDDLEEPTAGEESFLHSTHKLLSTTSNYTILYTQNIQLFIPNRSPSPKAKELLTVFNEFGLIEQELTDKLNRSFNAQFFSLVNMRQDDFGGIVLSGYCKDGQNWIGCLKRVNWDNKIESVVSQNSGSGSLYWIFILLIATRRRFRFSQSL